MHDPIAASRRTALRALAVQSLVGGLLALGLLPTGSRQALAAAVGGLAMVLGNAAGAWLALGGIVPAGVAFGRLLLGTMAKWLLALSVFAVALAAWHLPPLPLLAGFMASLVAWLLALNLPVVQRNR